MLPPRDARTNCAIVVTGCQSKVMSRAAIMDKSPTSISSLKPRTPHTENTPNSPSNRTLHNSHTNTHTAAMTPHQGQPSARLRHKTQTDEFRDFSASINRQRQNNNAQEPRANAPRLSNINRLFNNHQNVVGWPAMPSNLRQEPPANLLPVPTPAPPGPTEPHFVFADEREAYLAKCPPNADFSKVRASHPNSLTEHPLT